MRRGLLSLCLCALASPALADHPATYKGRFDFTVVDIRVVSPTDVAIRGRLDGVETLLGRFTGEVAYDVDPTRGTFTGTVTKHAANGDRLDETLTGHFTEDGSVGDFAIVGGTGRFRGATGGGTFTNVWTNAERTAGRVTFEGTLDRAKVGDFQAEGTVGFTNVQGATQAGGIAPYLASGDSDLIGKHTQVGSILNLSGLIPVDDTTLIFYGEVGPNPFLPGNPKVHVIDAKNGQIFCTWTAVFTLKILNPQGDAAFSGDGAFTVVGGTGRYKGASGTFRTTFETRPVPAGANEAVAEYQQSGEIRR